MLLTSVTRHPCGRSARSSCPYGFPYAAARPLDSATCPTRRRRRAAVLPCLPFPTAAPPLDVVVAPARRATCRSRPVWSSRRHPVRALALSQPSPWSRPALRPPEPPRCSSSCARKGALRRATATRRRLPDHRARPPARLEKARGRYLPSARPPASSGRLDEVFDRRRREAVVHQIAASPRYPHVRNLRSRIIGYPARLSEPASPPSPCRPRRRPDGRSAPADRLAMPDARSRGRRRIAARGYAALPLDRGLAGTRCC